MPAPSARIAPGLRLRHRGRRRVERHGDLPADEIAHHRRGAAIGHVHDLQSTGERLELLAAQMKDRAEAGRAVGVLAGVFPDQRDQALDVRRRDRRMHAQQRRRHADLRDRLEIADRVIRHLGVEAGIDRVRGHRRHQQRVAVGRSLCDGVRADVAPRADLVLDEELLAEKLSELGADDASDDIGRTAGRERHHDANRPVGIVILRFARAAREREGQRDGAELNCRVDAPIFSCHWPSSQDRTWRRQA